ncbi:MULTISPECIES: ribosomal protein L7/L12 [unclassified Streptomyces]|uniref:ribosomal protein L7/L12 n=1 Tax=unclassified Streptomyces TaxID=2593676 RepID=UPI00224EC98A|nr:MULTISPECIES: ribosomal protein L7/L12 [unclassified Streptomyces]MCX4989646.1 ribosomal protein L7/L12 [Streptomyces sp. NBC_00568]MCX5005114.1 ribosomal protein L7/L12 [Streptomyces sp. NBC_00638]
MEITGLFVLAALVIAGFAGLESKLGRTDRRIAHVERRLDLILDHLGIREDPPHLPQVTAFLRDGKKIQAIKAYREATGAGLKEAKDAVERMN